MLRGVTRLVRFQHIPANFKDFNFKRRLAQRQSACFGNMRPRYRNSHLRPISKCRLGGMADTRSSNLRSQEYQFKSDRRYQFQCVCNSTVECQPSKLITWVRLPSDAPRFQFLPQQRTRLWCFRKMRNNGSRVVDHVRETI